MSKKVGLFIATTLATLLIGVGFVSFGPSRSVLADGDGNGWASNYYETLLTKVATILGIEVGTVKNAVKQAQREIIDEAVRDGKLPQERADRLREHVDKGAILDPHSFKGHKPWPAVKGMADVLQAAAQRLSMTTDQLMQELKSGKSLAQIGEEKGVSRDALKTAILDSTRRLLDSAVSEGKITRERADMILSRLAARVDRILDHKHEGGSHQNSQSHSMGNDRVFQHEMKAFGYGMR